MSGASHLPETISFSESTLDEGESSSTNGMANDDVSEWDRLRPVSVQLNVCESILLVGVEVSKDVTVPGSDSVMETVIVLVLDVVGEIEDETVFEAEVDRVADVVKLDEALRRDSVPDKDPETLWDAVGVGVGVGRFSKVSVSFEGRL